MHYYIDGYNLFFYLCDDAKDFAKERDKLITLIIAYLPHKAKATLVFDGQSEEKHYKAELEITFTDKGESADEYILEKLLRKKKGEQTTIVTNDKKLASLARHLGADTLSINQFLQRKQKVTAETEKNYKDSKFNIERLAAIFEKKMQEESSS